MNKTIIYIFIAGIIIILFGTSAYFFSQNQKLKGMQSKTEARPTPTVSVEPTTQRLITSSPTGTQSQEPVVIIESQASLPPQDVALLQKRIIEPYIDYFKDTRKDDALVSMKVSVNTGASFATYPYKTETISKNGVNEGFLISKTLGLIDWWYPDCLVKCEFTDEFRAKYPEIIEKYE